MTTTETVVVHGATGSQGLPVVHALLRAGHRVRALSRHPEALRAVDADIETVAVDLADADALADAYAGADAVVAQLPLVFDPVLAPAQASAVAAAVERSGVGRVLFNVGGPNPPEPVGVPYVDARVQLRRALEASAASVLTIGPAMAYAENLAIPRSARAVLAGTVRYPLPREVPVPWLATDDLAALVAVAVTTEEVGSLVVVGPEALSGDQVAAVLTEAVGTEVRWETITPADYEELLRPAIGPAAAAGIAGFYAAAADAPPPPAPDPATVRVGPTTLLSWAQRQEWSVLAAA